MDKFAVKIARARAALIIDAPFFGSLAIRLGAVADPTCKTAWTDGRLIGYNPAWVATLTMDQIKGMLAHEVMHIANAHHCRRQDRDNKKWNIACDMAINPLITGAGFTLPDGTLDGQGDMSAEEIYAGLPDKLPAGGGSDQGDQGDGQNNGKNNSSAGAGGADPGGCGEVRDLPGKDGQPASPAEKNQAEQEAKVMVTQAATQARAMGNLPAGIDRMVKDMLQPTVDWRAALARFIQTSAKNDYRWTPPNRRFIHQGLYLPSCQSEKIGDIAIAVDTSGSVDQHALDQYAAEITAVLEAYDTTCHVIYCDTKVANTQEFTRQDMPLELKPAGGGGTSFCPPFTWLDDHGIDPACMIYLTDLQSNRYPDPPAYPVLWAHLGHFGSTPPFGEVIEMD